MNKYLMGAATAVLAIASSPASAAEYVFSFNAAQFTAAGSFITSDTAGPGGGYDILTTTGTLTNTNNNNMFTITGPTTFAGADNILFANTTPVLSFDGTSFLASNGLGINLYYSAANSAYRVFTSNSQFIAVTNFTLTEVVTGAVPEPASWAMMIGGFGLAGGALRRQRRQQVTVRYA